MGIPSTSAGVSSSATQVAKGAQATVWKTRYVPRQCPAHHHGVARVSKLGFECRALCVSARRWAGRDVAVKVPRMGTTADMQRFRKEVSLMAALGGEQHHIMPILGTHSAVPTHRAQTQVTEGLCGRPAPSRLAW